MARRHRLFLVDVERSIARTPVSQRFEERAGLDELRAGGVDEERARLHASEILARHAAARLGREPHLEREDVRLLEELGLAFRRGIAKPPGFLVGGGSAEDQNLHTETGAALGHQRPDRAQPEDAQRAAAQAVREQPGQLAALHALRLGRDVAARGEDQRESELAGGGRWRGEGRISGRGSSGGEAGDAFEPWTVSMPRSSQAAKSITLEWRPTSASSSSFGSRPSSERGKATRSRMATTT